MRIFARPLSFLLILIFFAAVVQSQEGGTGGEGDGPGTNIVQFTNNSPTATKGGVTVSLSIQPTAGYTCNNVTIACVDQNSNTLASVSIDNPGATVTQVFTGLGSGVVVDVNVNSTFQNGNQFAYPFITATVTTQ
jgi:hypothetical protein